MKFLANEDMTAGDSTDFARVGGTMYTGYTSVTYIASGIADLDSFDIPADTLVTDGDRIHFLGFGRFAANDNTKTIHLNFDGTAHISGTYSTTIANDKAWRIEGDIIKDGSNSVRLCCTQEVHHVSLSLRTVTGDTPTLTSAVTIKLQGNATSNGDIASWGFIIEYYPAP